MLIMGNAAVSGSSVHIAIKGFRINPPCVCSQSLPISGRTPSKNMIGSSAVMAYEFYICLPGLKTTLLYKHEFTSSLATQTQHTITIFIENCAIPVKIHTTRP